MPSKRIVAAELGALAASGKTIRVRPGGPRLRALAGAPDDGDDRRADLSAEVSFAGREDGLTDMQLKIGGSVQLVCQRCLEPIRWPVEVQTRLALLNDEAQAERLEDPFDSLLIPADGLALEDVIEDEVLASLPLSPVHGSCDPPVMGGGHTENLETTAEQTWRPFAELKAIVAGGDDDDSDK